MILILGGIHQGKTKYANENFKDKKIILNIDQVVKELLENKKNPLTYFKENLNKYKDNVITGNEIGSGVVPIKKEDRLFRDELGFVYQYLVENSEQVIRMWNGLPIILKG